MLSAVLVVVPWDSILALVPVVSLAITLVKIKATTISIIIDATSNTFTVSSFMSGNPLISGGFLRFLAVIVFLLIPALSRQSVVKMWTKRGVLDEEHLAS